MHGAIRAAGFSLMTLFVSCGVGAQDLKKNADGSVDLYSGPTATTGFDNNWVHTVTGKHRFSYLRLYAFTEASFDKSWELDDISAVE